MDKKVSSKLYSVLKEVGLASTSHGIPNILRSEKLTIKLMWCFFLIVSTGLCSYLIIQNILNYLKFEVITKTRQINLFRTTFPTVTVCNLNFFTSNNSIEYLKKIGLEFNLEDLFLNQSNLNKETLLNYVVFGKASIFKHQLAKSEIKNLSFNYQDILIECKYLGEECNKTLLAYFYHPQYGNCFKFNSGFDENGNKIDLINTTRTGKRQGLQLVLFIGVLENLKILEPGQGAIVYVHNNTAPPLSIEGQTISVNQEINIGMNKMYFNQLPKPYSNCDADTQDESKYNSELFKLIHKNTTFSYNRFICINFCYQKYLIEKCGCFDSNFLIYFNSTPCINSTQIKCLKREYSNFVNTDYINSECYPQCPLECNSMKFMRSVSVNDFSNEYWKNIYKNELTSKASYLYKIFGEEIKNNLIKINVYYESLSVVEINEAESQDIVGLLSNMGGIAGLFLGVSVLSFIEIIEILFHLIYIIKESKQISNKN